MTHCFKTGDLRLKVVTIATNETDGYKRFMRSAKMFDIDIEVIPPLSPLSPALLFTLVCVCVCVCVCV